MCELLSLCCCQKSSRKSLGKKKKREKREPGRVVDSNKKKKTHIALEGMQPTFKQVPPSLPRFSMQTVWEACQHNVLYARNPIPSHLEAKLGGLDGSNVTTGATTNDNNIVGASLRREAADGEETAAGRVRARGVGEGAEEASGL
jgi:hypothetical protein